MKLFKILLLSLALAACEVEPIVSQELRDEVIVENAVFKVWYFAVTNYNNVKPSLSI